MANATLGAVLHHVRRTANCSDGQLLARFVSRREEDAFALLVRRHGPMVLRVGRRVLGREQDAEDVYQATFLLLASKAASIRQAESVAGWLHGVAHRLATRAAEQGRLRAAREREAGETRAEPTPSTAWRDFEAALDEALTEVSPNHRAALTLCYLEGLSHEEAARRLGCAVGTVGSWVARGRKELRDCLAQRGVMLTAGALATALAASAAEAAPLTGAGMMSFKLAAVACLLAVAVAAGVAAWPAAPPPPVVRPPAKALVDPHGDPLPEGAVARIGTTRLRHGGHISSLAFTSDGKRVISHGDDGLRVWDAATGRELHHMALSHASAAASPDGRLVVVASHAEGSRSLALYDLASGAKVKELAKGWHTWPTFSPDGKTVAAAWNVGKVGVWDVASGRSVAAWKTHDPPKPETTRSLSFAAGGKVVVTSGGDKVVALHDAATGKRLGRVEGVINSAWWPSVAPSPDGKLLACVEMIDATRPIDIGSEKSLGSVAIRDAVDGKILRRVEAPLRKSENLHGLYHLAFSRDGKSLAACGVGVDVHIWDVATGAARCRIPTHSVVALAFSPDNKTLAVARGSNSIHLHDAATGEERTPVRGLDYAPYGLALTPDGSALLTHGDGQSHLIWDIASAKVRHRLTGRGGSVLGTGHLTAGGRFLIDVARDGNCHIWDVKTAKLLSRFAIDEPGKWPHLLAASPDGKSFAFGGAEKQLRIIDAATGKTTWRFDAGPASVWGAAFLDGGRSLAVWSGDRKARVHDLATGKVLRQVEYQRQWPRPGARRQSLGGEGNETHYIAAVSPGGRLVAFGDSYGVILLHDLATGREVRRFECPPDSFSSLAFSPDGRSLAWSMHEHPTAYILEIATGKERRAIAGHQGGVVSVAFSADGRRLATGGTDLTALVWDLSPAGPPGDAETLWKELASADAARAYAAVRRLAASPELLQGKLSPTLAADPKRLAKLLADLDGDSFAARDAATKELEQLGDRAAKALADALSMTPSLELRRRLEALQRRLDKEASAPSAERVQQTRALEALELAGTAAARRTLQALAKGAPGAWLTDEAKASLSRLEARK